MISLFEHDTICNPWENHTATVLSDDSFALKNDTLSDFGGNNVALFCDILFERLLIQRIESDCSSL